jgi:hypothetical protein
MFINSIIIILMVTNYPYKLNTDYQIPSDDKLAYTTSISACLLTVIYFIGWSVSPSFYNYEDNTTWVIYNFFNICSDILTLGTVYAQINRFTVNIPINDNDDITIGHDTLRPELDYTYTLTYTVITCFISLFIAVIHILIGCYKYCCCLRKNKYKPLKEPFNNV